MKKCSVIRKSSMKNSRKKKEFNTVSQSIKIDNTVHNR